jgi:hypothetical protein
MKEHQPEDASTEPYLIRRVDEVQPVGDRRVGIRDWLPLRVELELLFIADPAVHRGATALEPATLVLVVGGTPGSSYAATRWETESIARFGRRAS